MLRTALALRKDADAREQQATKKAAEALDLHEVEKGEQKAKAAEVEVKTKKAEKKAAKEKTAEDEERKEKTLAKKRAEEKAEASEVEQKTKKAEKKEAKQKTAEAVEGFAQTVSNSSTIHVCICAGSCTCCRNPSDTSAVTQPLHPLHQLHLSAPVPIESLQLAAKMRIQNRFGKGHQVVLLADISDTADSQSNFSSTQSES